MRKRFLNTGKPCPGPQVAELQFCPFGAVITREQGALAQRCRDCAYKRQAANAVLQQRVSRAKKRLNNAKKMRELTGVKKDGAWKPLPPNNEAPRVPIIRCKVCSGMPHAREQGRLDNEGHPVCLPPCVPGPARCRLCWEAYSPEPVAPIRAGLGSSAGTAAKAALW